MFLIDADGNNVGVTDTRRALFMAREQDLDLVEISRNQKGSVCKILDYGKYKYEMAKKNKEKQQSKVEVKEVRLTPRIDQHDIDIKKKQIMKWLDDHCKVVVSVHFKGRERAYKEQGFKILENFKIEGASIIGPTSEGNQISITLTKIKQ